MTSLGFRTFGFVFGLVLLATFFDAPAALAVAWTDPFGGQTLQQGVGGIIRTVIGYVGILALLAFVYGGFLWMGAGGDSKQVSKAKSIMVNTVLGMAIVFLSYAMADFVIRALLRATGNS